MIDNSSAKEELREEEEGQEDLLRRPEQYTRHIYHFSIEGLTYV
jgi:hypothetical protein